MSADRPFAIYADGDPIGATPPIMRVERRCLQGHRAGLMFRVARALARLARAASRRVGRTGGTTAPGRCSCALAPGRSSACRPSSTTARCSCRPPTARPPRRHDRRDARARGAAARAQPRRVEHGLGRGHGAAGRRPQPGQLGLFEVDEAWLPAVAARLDPRLLLLSNLFRDQLDRYGELELLADRWAELTARARRPRPLRAECRRPARGRPRPGAQRRDLLRRRGRLAGAARDAARRRLEALPQLRPRLRLRGRLPRPHGPVPVPELRAHPAGAAGGRHGRDPRRHAGLAREAPDAARRPGDRAEAARPLQRLQRRGGRGDRARARSPSAGGGRGARGLRRRVRPRRDDPRRRPPGVDPADQEPGGRERGAADAHAGGRASSTCGWR